MIECLSTKIILITIVMLMSIIIFKHFDEITRITILYPYYYIYRYLYSVLSLCSNNIYVKLRAAVIREWIAIINLIVVE